MRVNEAKNKPLHQLIKEDLLQKIETGVYAVGDQIPKEMELAEKYDVSRPTVRQAISALSDAGYVERIKLKLTFVLERIIDHEITHIISSFDTEISQKDLIPKTNILVFQETTAPEKAKHYLNISDDEIVYKLVRLRYAEQDPIVLVTTYIPKNKFPNLSNVDLTKKRLYQSFLEFGKPIVKAKRKLEVMKADETTSTLLSIPEGDPIFYFQTIGYSENDEIIEYSISQYRGDKNSFNFELDTFIS